MASTVLHWVDSHINQDSNFKLLIILWLKYKNVISIKKNKLIDIYYLLGELKPNACLTTLFNILTIFHEYVNFNSKEMIVESIIQQ